MDKLNYKKALRKSIAKKIIVANTLTGDKKLHIMSEINDDKNILDSLKTGANRSPTLSDLITVLSNNEKVEQAEYSSSLTYLGFRRWALK
jgi:hypothetical protein